MTDCQRGRHSIRAIKQNLKRLEKQIRGPYVRQADFVMRDRLARRLREALDVR
jgi:hypothetical protein